MISINKAIAKATGPLYRPETPFIVYGLFTASLLAILAACTPQRENLLLDLKRCTVDGISFDAALRWESATIDFDSERYRRFEKLVSRSAPFGVYYGVCGLDRAHGQAMMARLPDLQATNQTLPLETRPLLSRSTDRPKLERLFGPPNVKQGEASYKPVLHTDSSPYVYFIVSLQQVMACPA